MGETRPKLEIVRTDDGVGFYLDGKCLDETAPNRNPCYAAEAIAKALGRALGAEVVEADEPTRHERTRKLQALADAAAPTPDGLSWTSMTRGGHTYRLEMQHLALPSGAIELLRVRLDGAIVTEHARMIT